MGISASKRAKTSLANSDEFGSACESAYTHCLSLTQQAFPGVLPYQLPTASDYIHATLSTTGKHPLILKWVPSPPTRDQIDSAFRVVTAHHRPKGKTDSAQEKDEEELMLGPSEFKEWAVVLFSEAVAENAAQAVLARLPVGVAGIVGVGAVARTGKGLVGAAVGVYALGVATSVYLSLSG